MRDEASGEHQKCNARLAIASAFVLYIPMEGGRAMLIQNLALYEDQYAVFVNGENDPLFYSFDYDVRTSNINMQFQHFHTFYELCVMLCPGTKHVLKGKPYALQTFDIVGIPPNMLHMTQYPEGDPSKRLIIRFNLPRAVNGLSNEYEQLLSVFHQELPIFRFEPELQKKLYRKLNDIFLLADKQDAMRDLIIHLKFIEFLTLLFLHQDQNQYTDQAAMSPTEQKMYQVASYIHTHYTEDIALDKLAAKFFISGCYLSHCFKSVTGFTLTDYIQMTKVRNVQSMLLNTRVPITEAALASGFNSFSQFNRVFRKHIGISPSQYRRAHRLQIQEE